MAKFPSSAALALFVGAFCSPLFSQLVYDDQRPPPVPKGPPRASPLGNGTGKGPVAPESVYEAAAAFKQAFGPEAEAVFLPGDSYPAALHGFKFSAGRPAGSGPAGIPAEPGSAAPGPEVEGDSLAAGTVYAFLESQRALAGIENPRAALAVEEVFRQEGITVVRLRQVHQGLPVLGGMVIGQLDQAGSLRGLLIQCQRVIAAGSGPFISADQAVRAALIKLRGDAGGGALAAPVRSRLAVARAAGRFSVVWDLRLRLETGPYHALVDARSGQVLVSRSLLRNLDCAPKPRGNVYAESPAKSQLSFVDLPDLNCTSTRLEGEFIRTFNWTGIDPNTFDPTFDYNLKGNKTANGVEFLGNDPRSVAQVMIYYHATRFHAWLKEQLGFSKLDRPFPSVANVEECYGIYPCENAFYDPFYSYATGFGIILFGDSPLANFGLEVDVIAHEYTHGVVQETAALGEDINDPNVFFSDALNEAFADFFSATFVGDPEQGEYVGRVADQIPLRNLRNNRRWPNDIDIFSPHDTGLIWSGALWDIRQTLSRNGAALQELHRTDQLAYSTLVSLPSNADFLRAAVALVSASGTLGFSPVEISTIQGILAGRGLIASGGEPPQIIEPLQSGEEAAGDIAAVTSGDFRLGRTQYRVDIPENGSRLLAQLEGDGNLDLYVNFRSPVYANASSIFASRRSERPGASEAIEILPSTTPPLAPGAWFIAVANRTKSIASYRVKVTVETKDTEKFQPIASGETRPGAFPGGPALGALQYTLDVASAFATRLSASAVSTVDVDLFVRRGKPVEVGTEGNIIADVAVRSPAVSENLILDELTLPALQSGTYYFAIRNNSTEAVDYALTVDLEDVPAATLEVKPLAVGSSQTGDLPASTRGVGRLGALQYSVAIPNTGSSLLAELLSNSNLALYLRRGKRVAFEDGRLAADYASDLPAGGNESIRVDLFSSPPLAAGIFYAAMANREETAASYTVRATLQTADFPSQFIDLRSGQWLDAVAEGSGADSGVRLGSIQYRINLGAAAPGLDVLTDPQSPGNLDLYLRRDRPVLLIDGKVVADYHAETERGAEALTVLKHDLVPGLYYAGLVNRGRNNIPLRLIAVYDGPFPLSVLLGEGEVYEDVMNAAPNPPTGCLLSLDQYVVEVPANANKLEVDAIPLDGGPLGVVARFGSRILIDQGEALYDQIFDTAAGPIVLSGADLQPGLHFFALTNCQARQQRFRISAQVRFSGAAEIPLRDGALESDVASPAPSEATPRLHPTQFVIDVEPGAAELAISAWSVDCAESDLDLLVSKDNRITWEAGGATNAQWKGEARGPGGEILILLPRSAPPLSPGRYFIAVLNRETARVSFSIGAGTKQVESVPLTSGAARTDFIPRPGVPGSGVLLERQFRIQVYSGADQLRAALAPIGSPALDIDLYARYGMPVAIADGAPVADQSSETVDNGRESVIFPAGGDCLRPGTYFLAVGNFAPSEVTFTLTATVEGVSCNPLELGDLAAGEAAASIGGILRAPELQYCLKLSAGSSGFQVDLYSEVPAPKGNIDLFIRQGSPVGFSGNDATATFSSQDVEGKESISVPRSRLVAGKYFIAVGSRAPQRVPYTLSVRPLREAERKIAMDTPVDGLAEASQFNGLGWLSSEQFSVAVPAGSAKLSLQLDGAGIGSLLDLYVRQGRRVEVEGQTVLSDGLAEGSDPQKKIILPDPAPGPFYIAVRNLKTRPEPFQLLVSAGGPRLIRGDADEDGDVSMTDAIAYLLAQFAGGTPVCKEAADVDKDGELAVTDAVVLLQFLFLGGEPPKPPFPGCGVAENANLENCTGKNCR